MRGLLRRRGFAFMAISTLALGIGANTAIVSVVRGVVFRPLPYPEGDRLVHIWAFWPGGSGNISFPDGVAIGERNRTLEATATYQSYGTAALTDRTPAETVRTSFVTPSYFEILGARADRGRLFTTVEDSEGARPAIAVLSHGLWTRAFGSEEAIGRSIQLNGIAFEIVGILPETFADLGAVEGPAPEIFLHTAMAAPVMSQPPRTDALRIYWGLARLKAGVTIEAARDDLTSIARQMENERPATHRGFGLRVQSLNDRIRGGFKTPALILLSGSLFILLLGCANVTNLLLLRLTERRREMSVRRALGASSGRLLGMVLVEALLIAFLGGGLGTLLGLALSRLASTWTLSHVSPLLDVSMDPSALAASLLISAFAIAVVAFIPARDAQGLDLHGGLRLGAAGAVGGEGGKLRKGLLAAEVGFALVLLVGAGLMLRSFERLTHTPLGFRTDDLLTFRMDLSGPRYQEPAPRVRLVDSFIDRARALPGVQSATVWGPSMLGNATWVMNVAPEGSPTDRADAFTMLFRHSVSPRGLEGLGIERLSGRDFEASDTAGAPLVGIVSESAARKLFPGLDPLGRTLVRSTPGLPPLTVVGVARDVRHRERYSLRDIADADFIGGLGPQNDIYLPYAQRSNSGVTFAVRIRAVAALGGITSALRKAASDLDPALPLTDIALLDERIEEQERVPRALAGLLLGAALLAGLLAATGIYGVVSQAVAFRTREIGLRTALGAGRTDVMRLVVIQGLRPVGLGALGGLAVAVVLSRWMAAVLFDVRASDPATLLGVVLSLLVVSVLALVVPTQRALGVDPTVALRAE